MSERPWIEHTGDCLPVAVGTLVCVKYRNGGEMGPYPAGTHSLSPTPKTQPFSQWHWVLPGSLVDKNWNVIAYRIHSDDTKEAETRQARIDQFHKIADSGKWDIAPVKTPEKVRAGQ